MILNRWPKGFSSKRSIFQNRGGGELLVFGHLVRNDQYPYEGAIVPVGLACQFSLGPKLWLSVLVMAGSRLGVYYRCEE